MWRSGEAVRIAIQFEPFSGDLQAASRLALTSWYGVTDIVFPDHACQCPRYESSLRQQLHFGVTFHLTASNASCLHDSVCSERTESATHTSPPLSSTQPLTSTSVRPNHTSPSSENHGTRFEVTRKGHAASRKVPTRNHQTKSSSRANRKSHQEATESK